MANNNNFAFAFHFQMTEAIAAACGGNAAIRQCGRHYHRDDVVAMEERMSPVDCEREYAIEVRAVKTPEGHVGVGVMVMDAAAKVLWQESKYVGQGMSWHVAEYGGLLEAMDAAERLGVKLLRARVSSRVVSDQVRLAWFFYVASLIENSMPDCLFILILNF